MGARHAEAPYILIGQIATALYFSYFVFMVPAVSLIENTLADLNQSNKS
jgi:ubiquinol-cytochrome c reductase cytochrome b subunit